MTTGNSEGRGQPIATSSRPDSSAGPVLPSWMLPKRRRRPVVLVVGLVLALMGGVVAGWMVRNAGGRVAVLAVAEPVAYGSVVEDSDLTVARVASDSVLDPIQADRRGEVVGQHAAVELRPGMLLTTEAVTGERLPGPATEAVPVAVPDSRMPSLGLRPLDPVMVVATPAQDADPPSERPDSIEATVVSVGPPDANGTRVVDLQVPAGEGPTLAAWAATGRIAFVLEPHEG